MRSYESSNNVDAYTGCLTTLQECAAQPYRVKNPAGMWCTTLQKEQPWEMWCTSLRESEQPCISEQPCRSVIHPAGIWLQVCGSVNHPA